MQLSFDLTKSGKLFEPGLAPRVIDREVQKAMVGAANLALAEIQKAAPVGVSANLRRSFVATYEFSAEKSEVRIGSPLVYAKPVELGRRAAPVPIEPLTLWFRRKIGLSPEEARRAAFLTSRKKRSRPTPGQQFFYTTFARLIPVLNQNFFGPLGLALASELA